MYRLKKKRLWEKKGTQKNKNTSPEARAKAKQAAYAAKWKALEAAEAEKAEKDTDTEEDSRDFGGFPSDISLGHNLGCTPERKKRRD
ncbi:hypothetical protein A3SI_05949 [Nitritalea halalkaliphila LW7]|uniref:Uncharacterized protein n=1 Tax=Nitritalea halalkaliphila LW7 TaxID=1189621 RepID=I5C798_9BACT|nr:hypothetical protein [Nitritalea halalkaliphila]EIM77700.1 hypothetical protein A3SI_05949 [Nitritalea halalkaliphila LW7]